MAARGSVAVEACDSCLLHFSTGGDRKWVRIQTTRPAHSSRLYPVRLYLKCSTASQISTTSWRPKCSGRWVHEGHFTGKPSKDGSLVLCWLDFKGECILEIYWGCSFMNSYVICKMLEQGKSTGKKEDGFWNTGVKSQYQWLIDYEARKEVEFKMIWALRPEKNR